MDADEILEELTEGQESLLWLGNDGRQHLGDARLTVFRSSEHWAVFTEFPHFGYGLYEFEKWLGDSSNCPSHVLSSELKHELESPFLNPVPEAPGWGEANDYRWSINRRQFSVVLEGRRLDFAPTDADYAQADVFFSDSKADSTRLLPGQMLRFLAHQLDHPFFLSESLLRTLIAPEVEPEMELLLQTSHWQHPVFLLGYPGAEDDFPEDVIRNIPCWQVLSRCIAASDRAEWDHQDTTGFNTDWLSLERIRYEGDGEGYDNTAYEEST